MDIVERLREEQQHIEIQNSEGHWIGIELSLEWEAADTIETLRARVAELESQLDFSKRADNFHCEQLAAVTKERDRWKIDYLTADSEELAASQAENARLSRALAGISSNRFYEGKVGWEQLYKGAAYEASMALRGEPEHKHKLIGVGLKPKYYRCIECGELIEGESK